MQVKKNKIPSSSMEDRLLMGVTEKVYEDIRKRFLFKIPSNWNFSLGDRGIHFNKIKKAGLKSGKISSEKLDKYYKQDCSIISDGYIIYLTIKEKNDEIFEYPLFIGEMKKQGTNDSRIQEGLKKQAIGNAGVDRIAKNYSIAASYCYFCDTSFFPYNVFMHGCDFSEENITKTLKSKVEPFFGELNSFHPFFDEDFFWERKGGCCYYQSKMFTEDELYSKCLMCCEVGINHYLKRFACNKIIVKNL